VKFPESIRLETGQGGLKRLVIKTSQADAEIYLHGAHVTRFQPRGQKPVLFMSGKSWFEPGKPIRGGVPICFPWFGAGKDGRPAHGFARLSEWDVTGAEQASDGAVEINFQFLSDAATRKDWDGDFEVTFRVRIGTALGMELRVRNTSSQSMQIEEALHTYMAVSDVRQVGIAGLAGTTYSDRVGTPHTEIEGAVPIRIIAETDRIYLNTQATCIVDDPGWQRRLVVEKTGSDTTVLWNPWIAKAKAMPDFGDDEWPAMLCIETCNVREHAVTLAPGQTHAMTATVRVEQM
jgi:glucose-6-phosphate 1-epimerase